MKHLTNVAICKERAYARKLLKRSKPVRNQPMDTGSVHEDIGYSEAAMSPVIPADVRSRLDSAMNIEPRSRECSRSENINWLRKARAQLDSGRGEEREAA